MKRRYLLVASFSSGLVVGTAFGCGSSHSAPSPEDAAGAPTSSAGGTPSNSVGASSPAAGGDGLAAGGGASQSAGGASAAGMSAIGTAGIGAVPSAGGRNADGGTNGGGAPAGGNANAGAGGGSGTTGGSSGCGAGDPNLPPEPTLPATTCKILQATQNVPSGAVPSETNLDTMSIQAALSACPSGQAVKLVSTSTNDSFVTGPITIPAGVTLWVDAGATLYGTRDPSVYGSASALITVRGAGSGIVGDGVIDGQGGEPTIGGATSFWDRNGSGGSSPALIQVSGATNFTLYRITLHNAPMFHVKLGAKGFVVWDVTIKTPSKDKNSAGTALSVTGAHNTDGIDPGEAASDGFIVCSKISDGDDHIAIKGSSATGVTNLTIAHNHFEAGHGMSIGSEFTGGVSAIKVYDLSIDGSLGGNANGIRIKSDSSRGGVVSNVTYSDVCVRKIATSILLTPFYSTQTGNEIPQFTNIKIQNFHAMSGPSNQTVTLDGYDANHLNDVTLDNVIVDGISPSAVKASYTKVTLGPGNVNFRPTGTGVTVDDQISGVSTPNPCTDKWVTF